MIFASSSPRGRTALGLHGKDDKSADDFAGYPEGKRSVGRYGCPQADGFIMDLKRGLKWRGFGSLAWEGNQW